MRYGILLLLSLAVLLGSCNVVTKLGNTPEAHPPYLKLKDGTMVTAKSIVADDDDKKNIVADDKLYKLRYVAEYSDGRQTYARLPNKQFGPLVYAGKINVYSSSDARQFGYRDVENGGKLKIYSGSDAVLVGHREGGYGEHLYLQPANGGDPQDFKYAFLKRQIAPGAPGYADLQQFKRTRRTIYLVMLGGVASFVAGTIIAGNSVTKDKDGSGGNTNVGLYCMGGGMVAIAGSTFPLWTNRFKLRKAVARYNGVYP
jgi:hypothetical protein